MVSESRDKYEIGVGVNPVRPLYRLQAHGPGGWHCPRIGDDDAIRCQYPNTIVNPAKIRGEVHREVSGAVVGGVVHVVVKRACAVDA